MIEGLKQSCAGIPHNPSCRHESKYDIDSRKRGFKNIGGGEEDLQTTWDNVMEQRKAEPRWIKCLIQAVYDVRPSPSNLHIGGKADTQDCPLWGALEHILSWCTKAQEGR